MADKRDFLLLSRHSRRIVRAAMTRIRLPLLAAALLAGAAPAVAQPSAVGVFGQWGAFREAGRCHAIAEPAARRGEERPFAAIGYFPDQAGRAQVHIRLRRDKRPGSAVLLRIDGRSFQLIGSGRNAWAPDPAADAQIVAAMRMGVTMLVETRTASGALSRDRYALRGAATAIDAAALACAR